MQNSQLIFKGFLNSKEMEKYFLYPSGEYAVRIVNAMENHSLDKVFVVNTGVFQMK